MTSDSIPLPALRLGYRIQTESQRHTFDQQAAVEEFGILAEGYTTPKTSYTTQVQDMMCMRFLNNQNGVKSRSMDRL